MQIEHVWLLLGQELRVRSQMGGSGLVDDGGDGSAMKSCKARPGSVITQTINRASKVPNVARGATRCLRHTGADGPILVPASIISVWPGFLEVDLLMEYSRHGCASQRGVRKDARQRCNGAFMDEMPVLGSCSLLGGPLSVVVKWLKRGFATKLY